jgi:hypothetical protein
MDLTIAYGGQFIKANYGQSPRLFQLIFWCLINL